MADRTKIPTDILTDVVVSCRRRCCLCYGLRNDTHEKNGQRAHLDQDRSNNARENLACPMSRTSRPVRLPHQSIEKPHHRGSEALSGRPLGVCCANGFRYGANGHRCPGRGADSSARGAAGSHPPCSIIHIILDDLEMRFIGPLSFTFETLVGNPPTDLEVAESILGDFRNYQHIEIGSRLDSVTESLLTECMGHA